MSYTEVPFPAVPRITGSTESPLLLYMSALIISKFDLLDAAYDQVHVERSALATGGKRLLQESQYWSQRYWQARDMTGQRLSRYERLQRRVEVELSLGRLRRLMAA